MEGTPSTHRNLAKFHAISPFMPRAFGAVCLRKVHSGSASLPLTSIFPRTGYLAPLALANAWMSALDPGSWPPNWLQGKAWCRCFVG